MLNSAAKALDPADFQAREKIGNPRKLVPKPNEDNILVGTAAFLVERRVPIDSAGDYISNWIPGDAGYFRNNAYGANDKPSEYSGEHVFYVGGCFDENFDTYAQFYGHGIGKKNMVEIIQVMNGDKWKNGEVNPNISVDDSREFLRQPLVISAP